LADCIGPQIHQHSHTWSCAQLNKADYVGWYWCSAPICEFEGECRFGDDRVRSNVVRMPSEQLDSRASTKRASQKNPRAHRPVRWQWRQCPKPLHPK
jgi:hypothetical protein